MMATVTVSRALAADYEERGVFPELRPEYACRRIAACYRYQVGKAHANLIFEDAVIRKRDDVSRAVKVGLTGIQHDICTTFTNGLGGLGPHKAAREFWYWCDAEEFDSPIVSNLLDCLGITAPASRRD